MPVSVSPARQVLEQAWSVHRCNICHRLGACGHREPAYELALYEAQARRLANAEHTGASVDTGQEWLPGIAPGGEFARVH